MNCVYCDEPILAGESQNELHPECLIRMVAGSVAHQLHVCSCFGGVDVDPRGLTRRAGARNAAKLFCCGVEEGHA